MNSKVKTFNLTEILFAAGKEQLQRAMNECIKKNGGPLNVGSAATTKSFDLETCKYIIHAATPVSTNNPTEDLKKIKETVRSVMDEAKRYDCKSVAMCAIGCGTFKNNLKDALEAIYSEMVEALR